MSSQLKTNSRFLYVSSVTKDNNIINFDEGLGELTAEIDVGSYTMTDLMVKVAEALNLAGTNDYTVSVSRTTRIVTITSSASTDFLGASGAGAAISIFPLLGIAASDFLAVTSVNGTTAVGTYYRPQFKLQSYISTDDWRQKAFASVNKSASGNVQVQSFGEEAFMQCNIRFANEIPQPTNGPITYNPNGIDDLRSFMQFITNKYPIEFEPDELVPGTFQSFILESTDGNQDGVGYKLREQYDKGLPGYFDTGIMKFREIT